MKINLIPASYKKLMQTVKNVNLSILAIFCILLMLMFIGGFFHDIQSGIIYATALLLVPAIGLVCTLPYEKESCSTVEFTAEKICVVDKKGHCWWEILYAYFLGREHFYR